jgi:hypothetical protein
MVNPAEDAKGVRSNRSLLRSLRILLRLRSQERMPLRMPLIKKGQGQPIARPRLVLQPFRLHQKP